nr:hypothetical protein [Tanacetum cinerariifolium]
MSMNFGKSLRTSPSTTMKDGMTQKNSSNRSSQNPQPQALRTTFEARVRDYMASCTEMMERFENAIFKQREEINDKMAEMFRFLKEAKSLFTKYVNSICLARGEEERNGNDDMTADGSINKTHTEMPVKKAEMENEAENGTKTNQSKKLKLKK